MSVTVKSWILDELFRIEVLHSGTVGRMRQNEGKICGHQWFHSSLNLCLLDTEPQTVIGGKYFQTLDLDKVWRNRLSLHGPNDWSVCEQWTQLEEASWEMGQVQYGRDSKWFRQELGLMGTKKPGRKRLSISNGASAAAYSVPPQTRCDFGEMTQDGFSTNCTLMDISNDTSQSAI